MTSNQSGIRYISLNLVAQDPQIVFGFEGNQYVFDPNIRLYELLITGQRLLEIIGLMKGESMASISDVGYIMGSWDEFSDENDQQEDGDYFRRRHNQVMVKIIKLWELIASAKKESNRSTESELRATLIEMVFERAFSADEEYLLRKDTMSVRPADSQSAPFW